MNSQPPHNASPKSAISVQQLCKTYRSGLFRQNKFTALTDVSFEVASGEVFGLLGPNGAGKTTFLKILLGIIGKTSGEASMLSHPAGSQRGRRLVGYLPEQLRIPRHLTGHTALDYYGNLSNISSTDIKRKRGDLLELVGLSGRGKDAVSKYSKGMLQRLGLAQALLHDPKLLVLDEPTDGLDPRARAEMRELIRRLKDQGVTVFLNSHILQEVELVCDRVAILDKGKLRYCGQVGDIDEFVKQRAGKNLTRLTFQLSGSEASVREVLEEFPDESFDLVRCEKSEEQIMLIADFDSQDLVDRAIDEWRTRDISICQMIRESVTLEDAFLQILDDPPDEQVAAGDV